MRISLAAVLLSISVLCKAQSETDNRLLNQFIVMLAPGHTVGELMESYPDIAGVTPLSKRMNIWLLERNTTQNAEMFLQKLNQHRSVMMAQFDHTFEERTLIPNDASFSQQWNMLNTGQNNGLAGADIEATEAWDINHNNVTVNGDTLVVAIVDGKPDLAHEDLNFFTNYNEVPGNGIDDDGNGYIDDVNGWNVVDTSGNTNGFSSHATHLAGIVGAKGNDTVGVAGVCWGVKVLPVIYGSTVESRVVAAYDYTREMRILYDNTFGSKGAFVVATNSSFGVDAADPADYPIWCAMYDSLGAVGILSAAATANKNWDIEIKKDVPTACSSPWLIAVTNTTNLDKRNTGAAYGKTSIDLGAPGTGIYSTYPTYLGGYGNSTGTSMATPHVAGTIAAMYAAACKGLIDLYYQKPDSVALLIKQYILDGAEWVSSMNNVTVTGGRLNLYRAFRNLERFNCDSCNFDISIDKVDISCFNAKDGAMAVNITGNINDYTYVWSHGKTSIECLSMEPGFYTVQVTDTNGCRRLWTAELHNPDSITINSVSVIPATGGSNGNITVNATAGNDLLMYSLDGINYQHTATLTVTTNGSYTVYVKNLNGCVVQKTVLVSGMEQLIEADWQLTVYPNPANDELIVAGSEWSAKGLVEIFDVTGRKVYEAMPSSDKLILTVADWAAGMYVIKCGNNIRKFSVVH
jgi:hypothetical protein